MNQPLADAIFWTAAIACVIAEAAILRSTYVSRRVEKSAWSALAVVVLQIIVAAAMVEMHLPPALRSLHQAVGTALWITVVTLAALAAGSRSAGARAQIAVDSPSRGEFATPEGVST
jgi:heme A synthase